MLVFNVVISENNRFLLIQEAKEEIRGTWFFPAGRVNPQESFTQAAVRETIEESGLETLPVSISRIEHFSTSSKEGFIDIIRFTIISKVKGGKLKITEDKESIKASWFTFEEIMHLKLRSILVLDVIEHYKKSNHIAPIDIYQFS